MSRTSVHKLLVTTGEYEYLSSTMERKARLADKIEENKNLRKAVQRLADKIPMPPQTATINGAHPIDVNRNDLHILQKVTAAEHACLLTQVIPGYADRVNTLVDDVEKTRIAGYLKRAHEKAALLVGLMNKIEDRLG